jgi:ATP-dependent helicase/nuclease subunit B
MRQLLDRGGVILTANARAARALHLRYAESRLTEGVVAWLTPQIIDLHSWLSEQWKSLLLTGTEDRVLLNELQELVLWQRIMTPTLADRTLIEPAHMAKLAQEAYTLLATQRPCTCQRSAVDGRAVRRARGVPSMGSQLSAGVHAPSLDRAL